MIRILAGEARGRPIKSPPKGPASRPILGRMKKSLFDIMSRRIPGAVFLDLFAGTGSVGLEALSRGASRAVFVEKDSYCSRLLRENLAMLGCADRAEVISGDVLRAIAVLSAPFDLIFMGPPYKTPAGGPAAHTGPVLESLDCHQVLKAQGWLVSQSHFTETFSIPAGLSAFREEKYGDSRLTFFQRT
jgi:16S rRNA (guanine966-N2)-methyltransferase